MRERLRSSGFRFVLRAVYVTVRECRIWLLDLRSRIKARRHSAATGLRLHLGCGPKPKPAWINIDLVAGADLQLDLRRPLPFADGSCSLIYAEHFFEHLDYPDDAVAFLRDCHRLLAPSGTLSLGVPDATPPSRLA